jgi:hypothetical protein
VQDSLCRLDAGLSYWKAPEFYSMSKAFTRESDDSMEEVAHRRCPSGEPVK